MRVNRDFHKQDVVRFLEQVDEEVLEDLMMAAQSTISTDDYNETTKQVFRDTDAGRNLTYHNSLDDLFAELES